MHKYERLFIYPLLMVALFFAVADNNINLTADEIKEQLNVREISVFNNNHEEVIYIGSDDEGQGVIDIVTDKSKSKETEDLSVIETDINFEGSGMQTTRPFEVDDKWEIQWDASGMIFQVFLYDSSGSLQGIVANQQGAGTGSSFQPTGGEYYLEINAMGNWEIEIVDVK